MIPGWVVPKTSPTLSTKGFFFFFQVNQEKKSCPRYGRYTQSSTVVCQQGAQLPLFGGRREEKNDVVAVSHSHAMSTPSKLRMYYELLSCNERPKSSSVSSLSDETPSVNKLDFVTSHSE